MKVAQEIGWDERRTKPQKNRGIGIAGMIHVSDSDLVTVYYADDGPDPHEIVDVAKWVASLGCCRWITGNVNNDLDDVIDISDLVYLVDFMFNGGPEPPCFDEANIDGLSTIDISDLVYLVDYMFQGGPTPPSCP